MTVKEWITFQDAGKIPRYGGPRRVWTRSFLAQASSWPSGLVPVLVAGKLTCAEMRE